MHEMDYEDLQKHTIYVPNGWATACVGSVPWCVEKSYYNGYVCCKLACVCDWKNTGISRAA